MHLPCTSHAPPLHLPCTSQEHENEAAKRRAAYARRVPDEPPEGAAGNALLCVHLGEANGGAQTWRRFQACDTLEDLLNYVCREPRPRRDTASRGPAI